jgi:hypothetical protein
MNQKRDLHVPASDSHPPACEGLDSPPRLSPPLLLVVYGCLRHPRLGRGLPVLARGLHAPAPSTPSPFLGNFIQMLCNFYFSTFVFLGVLFYVFFLFPLYLDH